MFRAGRPGVASRTLPRRRLRRTSFAARCGGTPASRSAERSKTTPNSRRRAASADRPCRGSTSASVCRANRRPDDGRASRNRSAPRGNRRALLRRNAVRSSSLHRRDAEVDLPDPFQTVVDQLLRVARRRIERQRYIVRGAALVIVEVKRFAAARLEIAERLLHGDDHRHLVGDAVRRWISVIVEVLGQRFGARLTAPVVTAGFTHPRHEPRTRVLPLRARGHERKEYFL